MVGEQKVVGGCRCGAIRYEELSVPIGVIYCHCSDCRGYTGAPVVTWVAFDTKKAVPHWVIYNCCTPR